jgi:hypothetical protein
MNASRLTDVLLARERLLARIGNQRTEVAYYGTGLEKPLRLVDNMREVGRFLRAHPAVLAAAGGVAILLRGRALLGLGVRAYGIWRLAQRARVLLRHAGY